MTHAETYLDVLDVVGKMTACELGFLLKEVSGVPSPSTHDSGFYNPSAAVPASPPPYPGSIAHLSPGPRHQTQPKADHHPHLVSQFETYRGDLKSFWQRSALM